MIITMGDEVEVETETELLRYQLNGQRPAFENLIEARCVQVDPLTFIPADLVTRPEYLYDLEGRPAPVDIRLDGQIIVPAGETINVAPLVGVAYRRTAGLVEAYQGENYG